MVREIEYFDFDGYGMEKLLCKIQRELFDIRSDMQFHHNWKGRVKVFFNGQFQNRILLKKREAKLISVITFNYLLPLTIFFLISIKKG